MISIAIAKTASVVALASMLFSAPFCGRSRPLTRSAEAHSGRPALIEIAYGSSRGFFYWRLEGPHVDFFYRLSYLQAPTTHKWRSAVPLVLESATLTRKAGDSLIGAFSELSLSWDAEDYWYSPTGEEIYTSHIYEPSCGAIRYNEREVFACPVWPRASERQSVEANKIAWFLERLEVVRTGVPRTREADTRDALGVALWQLFQRIPSELVVRVHRDLPHDPPPFGPRERVDVGATLRQDVANALVFGEFVAEPMKSPEREVRLSGVYWYLAMPAYDKARLALVEGLKDPDPLVRAESGSALAAMVDVRDDEAIRALREHLARETDEGVKFRLTQALKDRQLLDPGVTMDSGRPKRR